MSTIISCHKYCQVTDTEGNIEHIFIFQKGSVTSHPIMTTNAFLVSKVSIDSHKQLMSFRLLNFLLVPCVHMMMSQILQLWFDFDLSLAKFCCDIRLI